ncbi:MAG: hypothetical protein SVV67_05705 [Bacillota bacterium]|nr:hypothetical protein [Bacillota bacterium]
MVNNKKNRRRTRWIVAITAWTFVLAVIIGVITNYSVNRIPSLTVSFIILLIVVLLGVVFDLVGTAAAAANIAFLNAKAARRVVGARYGVFLVKNAEQVANFCNDVVGDVSGVISGGLSAVIVLKIITYYSYNDTEILLSIVVTALVAAITVGGKAWGKVIAIKHSTEVMLLAGSVIERLRGPFAWLKRRSGTAG